MTVFSNAKLSLFGVGCRPFSLFLNTIVVAISLTDEEGVAGEVGEVGV
jgi:hypothetical protein